MYLGFFEQIVGAAVKSLGGPDDWALPYWNYSDPSQPNARRLPQAFRDATTPDGTPNPLRVAERVAGNAGEVVTDDFDVDLSCLEAAVFEGVATGGNPGFGGPRTAFNHSGGPIGTVERVPHGAVHVAVGGFMGAFDTAGLDPLFWLHHCNVDRLWTVWRRRKPSHTNPADAAWLNAVSFDFHDAAGAAVSMTSAQVVDETKPPLSYEYEDVSDPFATERAPARESGGRLAMPDRETPEMVGATREEITLAGEPTSTELAVTRPTGPARRAREVGGAAPARTYLNIENITGTGNPEPYLVYVNLPPGAKPDDHPELYAGQLPMFGVAEATQADEQHSGSGVQYTLDVSGIARTLQERNDWDPNKLRVTFVPKRGQRARESGGAPIRVGRVSLYES
jgi:tyrosinase